MNSPNNARTITFSERTSSKRLIKNETVNDSDIINNVKDNKHGQEESDSLRADKIYAHTHTQIQLSNKSEKHFLKIDTNSERSLKFHKELQSISSYCDINKQLINRPSLQKLITYFKMPQNKLIEIVSSSDESDFELIHHRKLRALNYDE
ncbi:uncharacterized protein TNCV_1350461 [Trichonephila clavipes]|nr:uncharacterized protein TNCV_1350461 [Trichonephila clavipes]